MTSTKRPLIVGAGPVGLGTALFLARHGYATRIVETKKESSNESSALAINPRTLEILEASNLTPEVLKLGIAIHGANFYRHGRLAGSLTFESLHAKYPFMVALSQASTERLLTKALTAAGGIVEREVRLTGCHNASDGVETQLEHGSGGWPEVARCPWLLAADGAHGTALEATTIDFPERGFSSLA